ncbi:hypothetical protein IE53DRAFT_384175 [Violaceomyces palustris]|uniref:Uncharacterized protein n=1 Tax=Violaceomyces palustris TaxID=1673888 RepID=A0ACD0P5L4_9BASI|nr:hypothetical protein IE53DRAFT_384175 [Violaceomyces palustris]
MARRDQATPSYLSAQPGFLNSSSGRVPKQSQSWLARFIQEEITHPEKRAGNLSIAWGITVFAAGIIFVRKAGDLITPVF